MRRADDDQSRRRLPQPCGINLKEPVVDRREENHFHRDHRRHQHQCQSADQHHCFCFCHRFFRVEVKPWPSANVTSALPPCRMVSGSRPELVRFDGIQRPSQMGVASPPSLSCTPNEPASSASMIFWDGLRTAPSLKGYFLVAPLEVSTTVDMPRLLSLPSRP